MKRRGFLGLVGGAMVAGPKVAQNAVKSLPVGFGGMPMAPMGGYGYATDGEKASPDSFYDWRLDEIAKLRRLISGEMSDEEREEKAQQALYALEPIVTQNVMALHSVSAHRKVAMFNQRMTVVREDIERFYHRRRLRDLLKDIGE